MKKSFLLLLFILCLLVDNHVQGQTTDYSAKIHGGAEGGVIGKIEDEFTITPMGQVNYEIPIPVFGCTGGVSPKLSIVYNSSAKDGLFGYGFDLSGLSIISRVPSNKFNDGKAGYVKLSTTDHFALDGSRLMLVENTYSTSQEYATENYSYSKITAYGQQDNPTSFKVQTKDGLTYEYIPNTTLLGEPSTSKALFWMLTKVTDTNGNYFTVTYQGDSSVNEVYPVRIDYTGNVNASLSPYASIRFIYNTNSYAPTKYIYGKPIRKSKFIETICVYSEEKMVSRFVTSYTNVNYKKQLTSLTEFAADGQKKNSTKFTWYNVDNFKVTNVDYTTSNLIEKATLTIGDYNGDGKADFVATPENTKAGWTGWKLFISNGHSFSNVKNGTFSLQGDVQQVVSGDYNGDGYDDIVVLRKYNNKYYNSDLYISSVNGNSTTFNFYKCVFSDTRKYSIHTVETNGDGVADLFLWFDNSKECKILYSLSSSGSPTPLGYTATRYNQVNWDRVEFVDFNGDGLTDVMNLNNDGYYLMICDGVGTYTEKNQGTWPEKRHYLQFGDFNGDGKTDMFLTGWEKDPNASGWAEWAIMMSDGAGSFKRVNIPKKFTAKDKQIYVMDINGDGFDDFYAIEKKSDGNNMIIPAVYLNDGTGNAYTQTKGAATYALDKWHFYMGDFNGDGKGDFVCTANWTKATWKGYQLFLMPENPNHLLASITDGMGNTTEIGYKFMTDGTVHQRGKTKTYPLVSFNTSWPVVNQVKTPNGIGGTNTTTYTYTNALMHKSGRGVLGFELFTTKDETTNTTTTVTYGVNTSRYIMAPTHSETKVGTRLVAESDTENQLLNLDYPVRQVFSYLPVSSTNKTYEYNSGALVSEVNTSTTYDKFGNVTRMETESGDLTTVTQNVYTNNEDNWYLGRLTSSTVTKSNAHGIQTRHAKFEYDSSTGLLKTEYTEPDNTTLGFKKSYVRDAFGNITENTVTPNNNSYQSRTSKSTYDSKGRYLKSVTNSLGHTTTNEVNVDNGWLLSSTDANGIKTKNTYDSFGRNTGTSHPCVETKTVTGWSTGMTEAPVNSLYFIYKEATGEPWTLEFFDCLGRTLRTVTQALDNKKIYTDVVYNSKGQVEKTSEPYFAGDHVYWNVNTYDACGRTVKQTAPDGSFYSMQFDGLTTKTTDPLGHVTTKVNDENGNLVTSIDNLGGTVTYLYDANGKCEQVKGPRTTMTITYDLMGNRTKLTDPDLGTTETIYNAYGELVQSTDKHGTSTYKYDNGGRLVEEVRPDMTITTTYDTKYLGAVTETNASNDTGIGYDYDRYGRITSERRFIKNKNISILYTYNNLNKVDVITYPSSLKVKNEYSSNGTLTSVKDNDTGQAYWTLNKQNARGQIEKETLGNGLVSTITYDASKGYLTSINTGDIQNWSYAYNTVGNLTQRKDNNRSLTESFVYDGLDRLTKTSINGVLKQEIAYDNAGNITSKTGVGSDFAYIAGTNRLASYTINGYTPKFWDEITYSSFNKITSIKQGDQSLTLVYGPDKERILAAKKDGEHLTTRYYMGRLCERTDNEYRGFFDLYIFAAGKAVAIVRKYSAKSTSISYLLHDQLGSVCGYTDQNGTLLQELSYDAWGRRRNPATWEYYQDITEAEAYNDRGFGGHEHLDLFEMVNMDGRMYDPVIGRFLSPDPIVQAPDFTQSLNRYSYCLNNPLSLVDPSGYSWFSKNWKSLLASAVGIVVSAVIPGSGVGVALIAGAAGGAAGALTGALLNGANIGQIAKSTFTGALWGGASGFLNFASGDGSLLETLFKHSFSQGWLEGVQGGNILHGMMSGAVSNMGGSTICQYAGSLGTTGMIAANAIINGTVSEIGGGKFANGAVTAAFAILFNEWMHNGPTMKQLKAIDNVYRKSIDDYSDAVKFYKSLGGEIEWNVNNSKNISEWGNSCAARLSYALNETGVLVIPRIEGVTMGGNNGKYYFLSARKMYDWLSKKSVWGTPRFYNNSQKYKIKNGVTFQDGFKNVSGHVEYVLHGKDGHPNGSGATYYYYFKHRPTYIWKSGR